MQTRTHLSPSAELVYERIRKLAENGRADVRQNELARTLGLSTVTVAKATRRLRALGMISVERLSSHAAMLSTLSKPFKQIKGSASPASERSHNHEDES